MHFFKLASLIFVNSILCAIGVGRECKVQYRNCDHMNLRSRKRAFESKIQSEQTDIDIRNSSEVVERMDELIIDI